MALSQDDVLELVAYLVTSARGLLDEPVDYGPMRLLTAAQRLCALAAGRVDDTALRAFLEKLAGDLPRDVAGRISDPERYRRALDEHCREIAEALMRRAGRPVDR